LAAYPTQQEATEDMRRHGRVSKEGENMTEKKERKKGGEKE
jgi:hypothetical protein